MPDDMEAAEVRATQLMALACRTPSDYAALGQAGKLAVEKLQDLSQPDRKIATDLIEEFFRELRGHVALSRSSIRQPVRPFFGFDDDGH